MHMMIERRADGDLRIPLHVPVELRPRECEDSFQADAVDVSRGGLSLRAPCLPDVGSEFECRFELLPGEPPIAVGGEVVWAHLSGSRPGQFGVRFVDLSEDQAALIAELVAEQGALGGARRRPSEQPASPRQATGSPPPAPAPAGMPSVEPAARRSTPPMLPGALPAEAELALDTGGELCGQLVKCTRSRAIFLQSLDVLSVGRGLWLRRPDGEVQRASIADLALRLDAGVPVLAMNVAFEGEEPSFADVEWEGLLGADGGDSDTVPDAEPPYHDARLDPVAARERTTVSEYAGTDRRSGGCGSEPASGVASQVRVSGDPQGAHAEYGSPAPARSPAKPQPHMLHPSAPGSLVDAGDPGLTEAPTIRPGTSAREPEASGRAEDQAGVHALVWDDGAEVEQPAFQEEDGGAKPADGSLVLGAVSRFARWAGRTQARVSVRTRTMVAGGLSARGREYGRVLRRTARTLLGPKKRRVTSSHRTRVQPRGSTRSTQRATRRPRKASPIGRLVLLSVVASGAIGLGVYALAPRGDDGPIALHRPVDAAGAEQSPVVPAPGVLPGVSHVTTAPQPPPEQGAAGVPQPASVPSGSPYAVNVDDPKSVDRARAAHTTPGGPRGATGPRFGAADVPRPEVFTLRMSQKVREVRGTPDKGGFTVVIPGSLSLDRAGPIASKHPAIKRSMILNKGDHSELTVRFRPGKRPSYRVEAHGTSLRILLEGK